MKFKSPELEHEYWQLTPKARYLAGYIDYLLWKWYKKEATITCIFYIGGSGVHSQWRAFDISSRGFMLTQIINVENKVNETFPYDVNRPRYKSAKWHKVDEKKIEEYKLKDFVPAYHFHFQVWIK